MAFNQNNNQGKQHEQADKASDTAKENINKTTEQGKQFVDAARDGMNKMVGLHEHATENTK